MERMTRLAAAALATAAVAAPAASARPAIDPPVDQGNGSQVAIEPGPAPVVQSADDGFDWGSAAIGAGAAGALVLLIGAGGTTYRHLHEHVGVEH
jgi:hypothetical protein